MANDQAIAELASSLSVDETPVKLRCATCSQIAYNALRLPCCEQNICETCYNELEDVCQVCHHEPLDKSLCTPNKSLRTTTKVFLKRKLLERAKESRKTEDAASQPAPAALPSVEVKTVQPDEAKIGNVTTDQPSEAQEHGGEAGSSIEAMPTVSHENPSDEGLGPDKTKSEAESHHETPLDQSHTDDAGYEAGDHDANGNRLDSESFQANNDTMSGSGTMNNAFAMNPMMAMGGMPNMMGMGMDPMMMNAMATSMFGNFGGPNMGMNGMNGMNGVNIGQFGGPWMSGQGSFGADSQGNANYGANGGYNMASHQGSYNQQYSHNDFQNGFGRRGFYPRGRGRRAGFYGGYGRFQQGYGHQGAYDGYNQAGIANDTPQQSHNSHADEGGDQGGFYEAGGEADYQQADQQAGVNPNDTNDESNVGKEGQPHADSENASTQGIGGASAVPPTSAGEPMAGDNDKPLPIQTFISDEPRSHMDPPGPNVPRGPAAQFIGNRGFRPGATSIPTGPQGSMEPKAIGVPGAPTGPRALREGLPNTGRSGLEAAKRGNAATWQPATASRSAQVQVDAKRSRSRSFSRDGEELQGESKRRSRSRSRGSSRGRQFEAEKSTHKEQHVDSRHLTAPSEVADYVEAVDDHESSRRSHRDSERSRETSAHRRHRDRSHDRDAHDESRARGEDRDYNREKKRHRGEERARDSERDRHRRHRRRSRSRSPGHRSTVPTPTSASMQDVPDGDGSRKRDRAPSDEGDRRYRRDRERRERKKSRRDRSYSRDRSSKHQPPSREASKTSTPITPGFPSTQRPGSSATDGGFRPPTGPSSKAIPTGPRADSGRASREESRRSRHKRNKSSQDENVRNANKGAEKDPHTLEREARDRERLLKEMQRRATFDGPKKSSDHRRRGQVKYEDEGGDDAFRVEREREGNRWR